MGLELGSGEFAERLRQLADIRGRIPLSLAEMGSPVAVLDDLSRAPYRLSGITAFGRAAPAIVAGQVGEAYLLNNSPSIQLCRAVYLENPGAAAEQITFGGVTNTTADPAAQLSLRTFERVRPGLEREAGFVSGLVTGTNNRVGLLNVVPVIAQLTIGALSTVRLEDLDLAMAPGTRLFARTATGGTTLAVTFVCRFWDDIIRDIRR